MPLTQEQGDDYILSSTTMEVEVKKIETEDGATIYLEFKAPDEPEYNLLRDFVLVSRPDHTGVGFDRESKKPLSLLMIWAGTSTMKSPRILFKQKCAKKCTMKLRLYSMNEWPIGNWQKPLSQEIGNDVKMNSPRARYTRYARREFGSYSTSQRRERRLYKARTWRIQRNKKGLRPGSEVRMKEHMVNLSKCDKLPARQCT